MRRIGLLNEIFAIEKLRLHVIAAFVRNLAQASGVIAIVGRIGHFSRGSQRRLVIEAEPGDFAAPCSVHGIRLGPLQDTFVILIKVVDQVIDGFLDRTVIALEERVIRAHAVGQIGAENDARLAIDRSTAVVFAAHGDPALGIHAQTRNKLDLLHEPSFQLGKKVPHGLLIAPNMRACAGTTIPAFVAVETAVPQ